MSLNKFIFNPEQEYSTLEPDLRTLSVLRDVANQIDSDIQLTVDVPSLNASGRLPVLDLELSIVKQKVQFIFYKKSVSNPRVIMYSSAISARTKRDTFIVTMIISLDNELHIEPCCWSKNYS